MIVLKSVELCEKPPMKTPALDFVFNVKHNVGALPTAIDADFQVSVDRNTGKVRGSMLLDDLKADSLEQAREKLAEWCMRLGRELADCERVADDVPTYEHREFILEKQPSWVQAEYARLAALFTACKDGSQSASEITKTMREEQNPLIYINGAYDQLRNLGYPDE